MNAGGLFAIINARMPTQFQRFEATRIIIMGKKEERGSATIPKGWHKGPPCAQLLAAVVRRLDVWQHIAHGKPLCVQILCQWKA
jgi:hypothetical protein